MEKQSNKPVMSRLLALAWTHKTLFLSGLLFIAAGSALALITPILIGQAIDLIVVKDGSVVADLPMIARYCVICALMIFSSGILVWLANIILSRLAYVIVRDIRIELFSKLLTLPLSYLDKKSRGDIMMRMTGFGENLSDGIYQGVLQLSSGVVTLVVTIICMFMLNWIVSLIVIALTPVSAVVSYLLAKRNRTTFKTQTGLMAEMSGMAEEYIAGSRLVRAYGMTEKAEQEFEEVNKKLFKSGLASQFAGATVNPLSRLVNNSIYAIVAIAGCLLTVAYLNGTGATVMTVGALSAFLSYATQFAKPFNDVTSVTAELQTASAAGRKIFDIIDNPIETDSGKDTPELPVSEIQFIGGEFSYNDQPFIKDLNFTILDGRKVAIVGTTGSGKTTVINLIMRFYDLSGGECIFDGKPIESYTRKSVRSCFGMVLQDTWLFEGTIRENIAYGNTGATDEQIMAVAQATHLDGFISTLENGYDTVITGDAEQLSEGQKQLITIARILLSSPDMLILDEATASVDARTEKLIQDAFAQILEGRTTITVAHRLSTIRDYDLILVMDKGCVIEQGNHEQLKALGGYYCKMLDAAGGV